MSNPLREAIERLTNPYAMQERVYRNRADAQDACSPDSIAAHALATDATRHLLTPICSTGDCMAPCCWNINMDAQDANLPLASAHYPYPQEIVTPLEVIVIRDADHLREVLDAATK